MLIAVAPAPGVMGRRRAGGTGLGAWLDGSFVALKRSLCSLLRILGAIPFWLLAKTSLLYSVNFVTRLTT